MSRAWTVQNKKGTLDFSQNSIKTPLGDLKQVSEEVQGARDLVVLGEFLKVPEKPRKINKKL